MTKQLKVIRSFLVWCAAIFWFAPFVAMAATEDKDVSAIYSYLATFYNKLLLPTGTVLAGFVIMAGGIAYAMSGGDPTKAQKAKEYIFGAISGLILLITAALIIRTIVA